MKGLFSPNLRVFISLFALFKLNHDVKYHFKVHILVFLYVVHAFDGYFMEMLKKT